VTGCAALAVRALALLLGAATAAGGCAAAAAFTVRQGPAPTPDGPQPGPGAGAVRILHRGDYGDATPQQAAVAAAAAALRARGPIALALFVGDNLYECGPDAARPGADACTFGPDGATVATPPSGSDPTFARLHEASLAPLLAGPGAPRVFLALGNHDVATWVTCPNHGLDASATARRKACLEVAHASPAWSMPGRHYVVDEGPARLIVIDSNVVYADYGGFRLEDEIDFVAAASAGCGERTCFLVGHHPPTTAGEHAADFGKPIRAARFARLLGAARDVRAYLAGHDHDLQHLRTATGLDVLLSGNGSRGRPDERFAATGGGGTLLFGSTAWGLGLLTVGEAGWSYRFEDQAGRALHCCAAAGAGRCEPVACAP
jgi:tartrate-resistant acid phosphatase type 5